MIGTSHSYTDDVDCLRAVLKVVMEEEEKDVNDVRDVIINHGYD